MLVLPKVLSQWHTLGLHFGNHLRHVPRHSSAQCWVLVLYSALSVGQGLLGIEFQFHTIRKLTGSPWVSHYLSA